MSSQQSDRQYGDRCEVSNRGVVQVHIATISLHIAKNVFQVHGIDAKEKVVVRKQFRAAGLFDFSRSPRRALLG